MDLTAFLDQRRADWKRLDEMLHLVEGSGLASLNDEQALEFGRLYRRAASDLNQAQTFVSGDTTVQYLNDLVGRAYLLIYGRTRVDPWALLSRLIWGYPAHFRRHFRHFLTATLILAAGGVFGYLASHFDSALARSYLLPAGMPMIQPDGEGEKEEDTQSTDELTGFSSMLFTHNLGVSLIAFALGMTLGVGTVWLMFTNGVLMGALAAVFVEAGQLRSFLTGVLPHGVLEIPACLIGGAGGLLLAEGLLRQAVAAAGGAGTYGQGSAVAGVGLRAAAGPGRYPRSRCGPGTGAVYFQWLEAGGGGSVWALVPRLYPAAWWSKSIVRRAKLLTVPRAQPIDCCANEFSPPSPCTQGDRGRG